MENKTLKITKIIIVNLFTIIRLIGAFILPFIYIKHGTSICSIWILCLFLTDAIDGFLARTLKVSTFFGSSMDALSDKILNTISYILLGTTYSIMIPPVIIEIAIMLTIYSTYRYGGNIQSTRIGKIKTVILDICVIASFILLGLPTLNINNYTFAYIITNTPYYIVLFGCICTIFELIALIDYKKRNNLSRQNPHNIKIKNVKRVKKSFNEIMHDAFDTDYYIKHKDEPIMKQFYKFKEEK